MIIFQLMLLASTVFLTGCFWTKARPVLDYPPEYITPEQLMEWKLVGGGRATVAVREQALMLTEGQGSDGVVLLSPGKYSQNVTLKFKVRPLQHEGACVVFTSGSSSAIAAVLLRQTGRTVTKTDNCLSGSSG